MLGLGTALTIMGRVPFPRYAHLVIYLRPLLAESRNCKISVSVGRFRRVWGWMGEVPTCHLRYDLAGVAAFCSKFGVVDKRLDVCHDDIYVV